jgi:hypothetical protein
MMMIFVLFVGIFVVACRVAVLFVTAPCRRSAGDDF